MTPAGSDDTPQDPVNDATTEKATTGVGSGDGRYGSEPRLGPALIATLVAIPVMVIAGFIAFAALRPDPVNPVESYAAESASQECAEFLERAPQTFEGYGDKQVSGNRATWPATGSGDDVILRCGVSRPAELAPDSRLQLVQAQGHRGVQWFITDTVEGSGQAYVAVDHRPYVALWVPSTAGNAPITDISGVIDETLKRGPLDLGR
ncbi:DUF3515 domain-containing protein [Gordonia aurantiaca]|uniref:DUF3515 domain-containing protein n=1 Tax=Gordonia sp. B21 TaxID=3151852 RepID=UPI0032651E6A